MQFDLAKATSDLRLKTYAEIQEESAYSWGSKAIVAFGHYKTTQDPRWLEIAQSYSEEAVEHAGLAGPETYAVMWREMRKARP